jgi:hypothetical protein
MDCWVDQGSDVGGWLVNTRQCGSANRQYGSLVNTDGSLMVGMDVNMEAMEARVVLSSE